MINGNWNEVEPMTGGTEKLPAGGYVIQIKDVKNEEKNSRLRMKIDIAEGPHKGFYSRQAERFGEWPWRGYMIKSYSKRAEGFFAGFLQAVDASNGEPKVITENGADEARLPGKVLGVVFGEEEYIGNDGAKKTRLYEYGIRTAEEIRNGDFTVPEFKKLEDAPATLPPAGEIIDTTAPTPSGFAELEEQVPF